MTKICFFEKEFVVFELMRYIDVTNLLNTTKLLKNVKNKFIYRKLNKTYSLDTITNSNLRQSKYSIEELEKNINNLNMKTIVNTQKLTIDFCVKYILNEDYAQCNEEVDILTIYYVMYNQPHLNELELIKFYYSYNNL
jgi:hypothetical protein